MTKYVTTSRATSSKTAYHTDPECPRLTHSFREATDREVNWHELDLCHFCENE